MHFSHFVFLSPLQNDKGQALKSQPSIHVWGPWTSSSSSVRYSHWPHYATSDICIGFSPLFVMLCRWLLHWHPWGSISIKATRQKPDTQHKAFSAKAVLGAHWSQCRAKSKSPPESVESYGAWEGANHVRAETAVWCQFVVYCLFYNRRTWSFSHSSFWWAEDNMWNYGRAIRPVCLKQPLKLCW